ncbi:MAG TPA: signal peptide peptidase SppA [Methanoregula sp.]|nr:signal peptide peptidase SppA [Methanoregula sp.]
MDGPVTPLGGIHPEAKPHPGRKWFLIGIFLLIIIVAIAIASSYVAHAEQMGVAVVRLDGTIVSGNVDDGSSIGSEVVGKELRDAADDPMTEAIVLRVNSPGGTPAGAEEIISDMEYAKTKKPVVVSMGDMATSAAYYVSSHADKIYADQDTFTGAIGVLWEFSDISKWSNDEGYNTTIVKSGAFKDMGNPSRPLTVDEQAYAQQIVNESFTTFINDVTTQRPINRADIEDGRVIRGADAVKLHLVDAIGNLNDAINGAKELARKRA